MNILLLYLTITSLYRSSHGFLDVRTKRLDITEVIDCQKYPVHPWNMVVNLIRFNSSYQIIEANLTLDKDLDSAIMIYGKTFGWSNNQLDRLDSESMLSCDAFYILFGTLWQDLWQKVGLQPKQCEIDEEESKIINYTIDFAFNVFYYTIVANYKQMYENDQRGGETIVCNEIFIDKSNIL